MRILKALWAYLKDWKNILVHSIIGLTILGVAFFLPVALPVRLVILAIVITLNVLRMKWEKKKAIKAIPAPELD